MPGKPLAGKHSYDKTGCQGKNQGILQYLTDSARKLQEHRLLHKSDQVPLIPFKRGIVVVHPHLVHAGVNLPAGPVRVQQGIYGIFLVLKLHLKLAVLPGQLSLEGAVSNRCLFLLPLRPVSDDITVGVPCLKFRGRKEPVQIAHGYLHAKDSQHPAVLAEQWHGIGNHILISLVYLKRGTPVSQPFRAPVFRCRAPGLLEKIAVFFIDLQPEVPVSRGGNFHLFGYIPWADEHIQIFILAAVAVRIIIPEIQGGQGTVRLPLVRQYQEHAGGLCVVQGIQDLRRQRLQHAVRLSLIFQPVRTVKIPAYGIRMMAEISPDILHLVLQIIPAALYLFRKYAVLVGLCLFHHSPCHHKGHQKHALQYQ